MPVKQMIQPWQIKKIFAIANQLGIDKEDIYQLGNVSSTKDLTYQQANAIINHLQGNAPRPSKRHEEVAGMISEGQQKKVWRLMYQLKEADTEPNDTPLGKRLCGIIKRQLDLEADPKNPFKWVDDEAGHKLIEILKKYVANAKKRGGTG